MENMTNEFAALDLQPQLLRAVTELGFESPTPIQTAVIPLMLAGQDLSGQAQTGTGKTAAFGLPLLQNLDPNIKGVQGLVVAPTRELALQVSGALSDYGRYAGVRILAVYGGTAYGPQIGNLRRGVDVVVGTPGRLLDLIRRGALDLSSVQTVVLDEADEMLSMGFIEDIETLLDAAPNRKQTALFSATLPPPIRRLAQKYLDNPRSITIEQPQLTVAAIEQRSYLVNQYDKLAALTRLFEVEPMTSVLIFARTRLSTGELANELTVRGFPAETLNGDLSQDAREQALDRFRKAQTKVLVATDVAARGLDVDDISHVINYDLPQDPDTYVHRVGRTGRAGRTGVAITLVTPQEQFKLRRIEKHTGQKITAVAVPTDVEIAAQREEQLTENMMVWLRRGRCSREREMVQALVAEGNDLLEIAAAALKLARHEEKQRPIAPMSVVDERPSAERRSSRGARRTDRRRAPVGVNGSSGHNSGGRENRSTEKGMVRLTLDAGKAHGVRPADVVGTIAYHADIPGRALGAIVIREQHTFVDVPEQYVNQVLAKAGSYQVHRRPLEVALAA
jgi:ATP-dependent RNA helicase DeaD